MNTSQAARSLLTSSQERTPVSRSNAPPSSATAVISTLVHDEKIHRPHTSAKTQPTIHSLRFMEPIFFNSPRANSAASGVCFSSGGFNFITTHGTASSDNAPGTIAATNQLSHVTLYP